MYVHELSADQRQAFLILAREIIDADNRLAIQEVERLDRLYDEAGVAAETADAPRGVGDLNLLFPTPRDRCVVLLELLLVAYADGVLHPKEEAALQRTAARLEIDQGLWTNLIDWAARFRSLVDEADAFGR